MPKVENGIVPDGLKCAQVCSREGGLFRCALRACAFVRVGADNGEGPANFITAK